MTRTAGKFNTLLSQVYALLSEHGGQSIHLEPHPSKKMKKEEREHTPPEKTQNEDSRVLLAITITQNAVLSLDKWVEWLQNRAPKEIVDLNVNLESVFRSHSTLALVSIPIHSWDWLRNHSAYQFVGFIKSEDLLLQFGRVQAAIDRLGR